MKKLDFDDKVNGLFNASNLDKLDIKQWHAETVQEEVDRRVQEEVDQAKEKMAFEFEQKIRLKVQAEETEKNRKQCKVDLTPIKPLLFDTVTYGEKSYDYREFIHPVIKKYSGNADDGIRRNPHFKEWERTYKNRSPKYLTSTNANLCLIINASGPGVFEELAVFTDGSDKPHLYPNGNVSTAKINAELQLEDDLPPNEEKWVAASYRLSVRECANVYFYNIPKHSGWNRSPNGGFEYVSSASVQPGLEELYPTEILEHRLLSHKFEFDKVINAFKKVLPQSWKAKLMVVERVKSILLPWFEKYGFINDCCNIIVYRNEKDKQGCIALAKRDNCESTIVKSLIEKGINVKQVLSVTNDAPVIFTFSLTIESRCTCSSQFSDILLDLKGENGIEDPTRKSIIILTETPARIPEGVPAIHLAFDEKVNWGDIKKLQTLTGVFDYSVIRFIKKDQPVTDAFVRYALKLVQTLSNDKGLDLSSKSTVMSLATAWLLKRVGIVTEEDFNSMLSWITSNASAVSSSSAALCSDIAAIANNAILNGELTGAWQDGQYPSWNPSKFFVASNGTYNLTPELFEQKITSKVKGTNSFNKCCQALEKQGMSHPNRTDEHTSSLNVTCEGIGKIKRTFISLSPKLFSHVTRQLVEKTLIADTFHALDTAPRAFNPFIKHKNYDLIAGQVIRNYCSINPFVCVTGSPASGKTDFLHMQAVQRAVAGDTVIILDATNSSCLDELKAHKFTNDIIDERILFWDMSRYGWPFELMDFSDCEKDEQKIQRLSSWLLSGSHMNGPSQISIIRNLASGIVHGYGRSRYTIRELIDALLKNTGKEGEIKGRLLSLFSTVANSSSTPPGWENIVEFGTNAPGWEKLLSLRGKIIVISTGNAVAKADCNALDIVLDSFYGFKDNRRESSVTLVFDEIQRMNCDEGAPLDVILSTGRKLNISAFVASQRFAVGKGKLAQIEEYCDTKIFFRPMDSCLKAVATTTKIDVDTLLRFEQGECAYVGTAYSERYSRNMPVRPTLTGITYRPSYIGDYDKK